ncbi:MAG: hypothetical protein AAB279_05035, partial [Candidatus Binatota bacterium]
SMLSFSVDAFCSAGEEEKLSSGSSCCLGAVGGAGGISPAGLASVLSPRAKMCLQREQRKVGLGVVTRLSETL